MKQYTIFFLLIILSGCTLAEVKVEVLSERTALENQVLGTYNSLDREMLLTSSVRGVDAKGQIKTPPQHSQDHKDAISAMQLEDFHKDDIDMLKQLGWLGENNKGLLEAISTDENEVPTHLKDFVEMYKKEEFHTMVKSVNLSRRVIMQRVIDMNENLSEKDMPEIQSVFGKINGEHALKGEKIQAPDNTWIIK